MVTTRRLRRQHHASTWSQRVMHAVALIGLIGLCACPSTDTDVKGQGNPHPKGCVEGFESGECAPDFILPEASGDTFTLSDSRGSVVLLASEAIW
jgi:hypothetical protein